jgi:uncharacterized paraquat-inducible protein A
VGAKQMKIAIKFFEKEFTDEDSKQAYLNACKWVAQNIISKVEISDTMWKIEKKPKASYPTFQLELYCMLNDTEGEKGFCTRCKELHCSFFVNEEYNCNRCNMKAYLRQAEDKLRIKKQYRKELLNNILDE